MDFPGVAQGFQSHFGGFRDAFIVKLNATGSALLYSTYFGGIANEFGQSISLDSAGTIFVSGLVSGNPMTGFPLVDPLQSSPGSVRDAFLLRMSTDDNRLLLSSFIGGAGDEEEWTAVAHDGDGNVYVTGETTSLNFPIVNPVQPANAGLTDAYLLKISFPPVNQPPVANAGGPYSVGEGFSITLTASGSDPDGDPLTYSWDLDNNGSFETAGQSPTFSAVGRDGPTSQDVVLRVCDNKAACATSTTIVDITNVSPTANNDSATTNEDTSIIINVVANDTDVAGDPLIVTGVVSSSANGGTIVINGDNTVTYTPALNFFGTDTFTYTINDGDGGTATAIVTIDVNAVNDAPVSNVPGPQSTSPNSMLIFSIINGNPMSIADVDAGSAAVQVTLTTTNGTLTLGATTGLTFITGDGTADSTMTFAGSIAAINAAIDGLRYDPAAGFTGVASISITTNDLGNSGAGGPLSDTDTVLVTVSTSALVDLMLTASAMPNPILEGTSLTYTLSMANIGAFTATGITLSNDLPNSVTFISATSSQGVGCTRVGNTITCRLGALVSGASATVTIVVTPTQRGVTVNRASVAANERDSDPVNNRTVTQSRVN
jgi:hypothetical protein